MIKSATIFKILDMSSEVSLTPFEPCLPSQESSHGWTPPNGGELCESINGQLILQYTSETKKIPTEAVNRRLEQICAEFEKATGRKQGKKARKEIKEDIIVGMLPNIIPTRVSTICWISRDKGLVIVDAAPKRATDVAVALSVAFGMNFARIASDTSIKMRGWLTGTAPEFFDVGIDCDLASTDESATRVKYVKHNLDIPEVSDHIRTGMSVKSVGLMWEDNVYFVLNEDLSLKKIEFFGGEGEFDSTAFIETNQINAIAEALMQEFSIK